MAMKDRLQQIIRYKTDGRKAQFAALLGWSPQYLSKILRGESFGVQPILTILQRLPEISARWFLFGEGEMLEMGKVFALQRDTLHHVQTLLDLDRYIAYMDADELHTLEKAIANGTTPAFPPTALQQWEQRRTEHERATDERFRNAYEKSLQCKRQTAK